MASRTSKYAHVVQHLSKYVGETPDRLQLINGLQEEILKPRVDLTYNVGAQMRSSLEDATEIVQTILTLAKRNVLEHHASHFAAGYVDAREVLDVINEWKSSAQLLVDAYESLMVSQMEKEDVASMRLESGAAISTFMEPYASVTDKDLYRRWCIANGYEEKLQLWPATTLAITKERLLAGEPAPDGIEVFAKTAVRLTKG